jgi:cyclic 2,3-diphosphoglycerate synthetase
VTQKVLALVDGEHYVPVTRAALGYIDSTPGRKVVAAILIGGTEKIGTPQDVQRGLPVPVVLPTTSSSPPISDIVKAIRLHKPDVVVDLSDEPVVNYQKRLRMASAIVAEGVIYEGADFTFSPIPFSDVCNHPSIKIIGLGKRVGKTAISTATAMTAKSMGLRPCVVKAARGGPEEVTILEGDKLPLTAEFLLGEADKGRHAASDYYQEALIAKIPTVGARRCGGGMVGKPYYSTEVEGVKLANSLPCNLLIVEGSGTTVPAVFNDCCELVIRADQQRSFITEFFGPYRIQISDLIIMTMCEESVKDQADETENAIREVKEDALVVRVVLRPQPLGDVDGRKIMFTSVAPAPIIENVLAPYLEKNYHCKVVGYSCWLSNRPKLREDLERYLPEADMLVTEFKAASIDVATRMAVQHGLDVVYVNNTAVTVGGDARLEDAIGRVVELAKRRFEERRKPS